MAELLEIAQLLQHHRVSQVQIGSRRVESELHRERSAARELRAKLRLDDDLGGASQVSPH